MSAKPNDRCVSYSTYEKAYEKLQEWCDKYGYELEEQPYEIWNHDEQDPEICHEAKCLYNFRATSDWSDRRFAFTIVEMKTEEQYKQDLAKHEEKIATMLAEYIAGLWNNNKER